MIEQTELEKIKFAAIHVDDGQNYHGQPDNIKTGFVTAGNDHHACITELINKKCMNRWKETEGFLTNTYRFVDRKEAFVIALDAKQIDGHNCIKYGTLFSADLILN